MDASLEMTHRPAPQEILLNIKHSMTGLVRQLCLSNDYSVSHMRAAIAAELGLVGSRFHLTCGSTELNSGSLADNHLCDGSTIVITPRLSSGHTIRQGPPPPAKVPAQRRQSFLQKNQQRRRSLHSRTKSNQEPKSPVLVVVNQRDGRKRMFMWVRQDRSVLVPLPAKAVSRMQEQMTKKDNEEKSLAKIEKQRTANKLEQIRAQLKEKRSRCKGWKPKVSLAGTTVHTRTSSISNEMISCKETSTIPVVQDGDSNATSHLAATVVNDNAVQHSLLSCSEEDDLAVVGADAIVGVTVASSPVTSRCLTTAGAASVRGNISDDQ